jgi:hypothetical protein
LRRGATTGRMVLDALYTLRVLGLEVVGGASLCTPHQPHPLRGLDRCLCRRSVFVRSLAWAVLVAGGGLGDARVGGLFNGL